MNTNQLLRQMLIEEMQQRAQAEGSSIHPTGLWLPQRGLALEARRPEPTSIITRFQSGHGFTQTGSGGSTNLNDTSDFVNGDQCVSLSATDAGIGARKNDLGAAYNLSAGYIGAQLYVGDPDNGTAGNSIRIDLGDGTGLTAAWTFGMGNAATYKWFLPGEWNYLTLSRSAQNDTIGSPALWTNIRSARVFGDADTAETLVMKANMLCCLPLNSRFPTGAVLFSYDDNWATQWTVARSHLDQYGFPGNAYTIWETLGTGSKMTLDQLKRLAYFSGWEVCCHSYAEQLHSDWYDGRGPDGTGAGRISVDDVIQDLTQQQQVLYDNGFTGMEYGAYPSGAFNSEIIEALRGQFRRFRTIITQLGPETYPCAEPMRTRPVYIQRTTTLAEAKAAADKAVSNGDIVEFVFHKLETSSSNTSWPVADHLALVDYVATLNTPVLRVSDLY